MTDALYTYCIHALCTHPNKTVYDGCALFFHDMDKLATLYYVASDKLQPFGLLQPFVPDRAYLQEETI